MSWICSAHVRIGRVVSARRLLVVTYYYPPQPGSGSNRWAAMVKYLRRLGHDVTVLTAAPPGHPAGESEGVIRTGSLNSSPLLRRVLLRRGDEEQQVQGQGTQGVPGGVMATWQWKLVVPDPWLVSWGGYAWRAVRRELRRRPVDCLITSSPSESTHTLGLTVPRASTAWVADFRDGWGFEPLRPPFPTALQRGLDRRLEARVVRAADAVVGVTAPIAEDFATRLGVPAELVTNGFDPELAGEHRAGGPDGDSDGFTLVHTGALSGPRGRDPRPLLRALRLLAERDPSLRGRLRLVVAGRSEEDERALVESEGVGDLVHHVGYMPRPEALKLQRGADALLLITSRDRCEATGKLYEYMASGRPVLALAEGNEAARIVAETNIGRLVAPDDVEGIAGALADTLDGALQREYAPRSVERYAFPTLAEQMAAVIEKAIERRGRARA
jgi:glycosyltransferase involved in cell wall biosynthesis